VTVKASYKDGFGAQELVSSAAVVPASATAAVTITQSALFTGDDGSGVDLTVKLTKAPEVGKKVTLSFAVSDATEAKLDKVTLEFTSANWSTAQTIKVTGLADYANDGDVAYNVTGTVTTDGLAYKRVKIDSIALINKDDVLDKPLQLIGTAEIDYLTGGNGADRLYGSYNMDELKGGRGDDRLYGQEDDDLLYGELGNDSLYGGVDDDLVDGGEGNDYLEGNEGDDTVLGGSGNDTLNGGTGADSMVGGAGDDTYYVDSASDVIDDQGASTDVDTVLVLQAISYKLAANIEKANLDSTSGASSLTGNTLDNTLTGNDDKNKLDGGVGNDQLAAGAGDDTLLGGDGLDTLSGGLGNDSLTGGLGDDLVDYSNVTGNLVVDLTLGTATGEGSDKLVQIEDVSAGSGADKITGSTAGNMIIGGAGNDTISAGAGNDEVTGGLGNDSLDGGAGLDCVEYADSASNLVINLKTGVASGADIGTDTLSGFEEAYAGKGDDVVTAGDSGNQLEGNAGADTLMGGLGMDTLVGGVGNDSLSGGLGDDLVDFSQATGGMTVDLVAGVATGDGSDTLTQIEDVSTGVGSDVITGSAASNELSAGAGNDSISAGAGNDLLNGGAGNDTMNGGAGEDRVDYSSVTTNLVVDLGLGTATGDGTDTLSLIEGVSAGSGADKITGSDADNQLTGGAGNDTLSGGLGSDDLVGGTGADVLSGGTGNDVLYAGDGNDVVDAGEGDDLIIGGDGAGNDIYTGGAGIDTVKYASAKAAIVVNLSAAKDQAKSVGTVDAAGIGVDQLSGIENVIGGNYGDLLSGDANANVLSGALGNDTITGGAGADKFVFDTALGATNLDVIKDFVTGTDKLVLDDDVFAKFLGTLSGAALSAENLKVGAGTSTVAYKAQDANDYLVYDTTSDLLYYDADGSGSGAAVALVKVELVGTVAPTATDFLIVS
jgi:Ca2+-binding RTX toxin-like protein